jgi:hypothetical protein
VRNIIAITSFSARGNAIQFYVGGRGVGGDHTVKKEKKFFSHIYHKEIDGSFVLGDFFLTFYL